MTVTPEQVIEGHLRVIESRLLALADAIRARDWERVEWEHDRVRRAVDQTLRATSERRVP